MSKYLPGDKVVIFNDNRFEVAMVTNIRKKKNVIAGYDVRTERGSGIPVVPINKSKVNVYIDVAMTKLWLENGGTNNMYIDRSLGHTRANYNDMILLLPDGHDGEIQHLEKFHDFIFPTIGARSY